MCKPLELLAAGSSGGCRWGVKVDLVACALQCCGCVGRVARPSIGGSKEIAVYVEVAFQ